MGKQVDRDAPEARHARREAAARAGAGREVRVLEPSPPAAADDHWFADDPTAADGAGEPVLPFGEGAAPATWVALVAEREPSDPSLAGWAADRWLGPWRSLPALRGSYTPTREALHQLAVYVVSPARRAANGKIGLRYTHRGFGTPFFASDGTDRQVRVEQGMLVVQDGDGDGANGTVRVEPVSTLAAAAGLIGVDVDRSAPEHFDVPPIDEGMLDVDVESARAVGDWFGFCCSVLEELRALAQREATEHGHAGPSRVQLWPEHFDLAFDAGDPEASARANFGGSPGDASSAEPYLYVGPFERQGLDDPYWNASFGATLGYRELLAAPDQRAAALAFFRSGHQRLTARPR